MQKIIKELIIKIKNNRVILLIGGVIYLLGIILGLFFNSQGSAFYEEYAVNFYSLSLLPSSSAVGFLFKRILNLLLLFIPVILFAFNGFTLYLNFIFVFYKGFVLSISLKCLFVIFGFNGILIFIFLSLIQNVITTTAIILFILLISSINCTNKNQIINYVVKFAIISLLIALLGIIIETLLIICILRPFNFYF